MKRNKGVVIWLLAMFLAVGCGKKEEIKAEEIADAVYAVEYQIFHMRESTIYLSAIVEDGTVCFAGYGKDQITQLFSLKPGQKVPKEIPLKLEPETWITSMGNDWNGNLLLACSRYEDTLELLEIKQISHEGKILRSIDLTEVFCGIPDFEAEHLAGDESGNFYIGNQTKLYVVDAEGKLRDILEMEAGIDDLFLAKTHNMLWARLSSGKLVSVSGNKGTTQSVISDIDFGNGIYAVGREKELLYTQSDALYTCDTKDKVPVKILNWTDYDINSSALQSIAELEDGRIAVFSVLGSGEGECELALLTRTPKERISEKTVITYGCAYPSSLLYTQVVRFNKISTQYRIELKQYGENSIMDMDAIKDLIRTDIISGNAPDIIDLGAFFTEEERCGLIEAGVLEDLNPYFEKEEDICREDYLEKVLQVYERDNKLYAIMPTFNLYGLVGRVSDLGENDSWTLEEMESFLGDHTNDAKIAQGISRENMLDILCKLNMDKFVDRETGECHFDSEDFKQILEFSNHFNEKREDVNLEQTRNGEVLLLEASLMSVVDFQIYEYLFDEPVNFIGYPTDSDNGLMALPCVSVLGMNRNSKNKEGAWQFICFLLEEDQQEELGRNNAQGIPIKKSVIDQLCEKQMEVEYEEDEKGNLREKSKGIWEFPDYTIEYYAATQAEVDCLKELFEKIGNSMETGMDQRLIEIIKEEAGTYFGGQKSAENVAEIIQNRAQNYMNER